MFLLGQRITVDPSSYKLCNTVYMAIRDRKQTCGHVSMSNLYRKQLKFGEEKLKTYVYDLHIMLSLCVSNLKDA